MNCQVCRVCLAMGVKMYHMLEHNLSIMYEQIAGLKISTEDILPKMLCWECVARLSSAHNFIKKALRTHLILVEKIKSSSFVTMDDLESIDKTQLRSSLGVKFYKDNYSYINIVKENDNCYETVISEPNYINTSYVENQIFVTQDIVSAEKDPIKKEYLDDNEEQISEYEKNIEGDISYESVGIKFQNTEFKTEMLEISVTENASDEEMVIDNERNATEMSEGKIYIKVETTEDYDLIKQKQMRKKSEALPRCKEPRVVLDDIMLNLNKHNTQDNCKYLTSNAQLAKDINGTLFLRNSSISDPVNVRTGFSDAVSSDKLHIFDKSLRNDKQTNNSVFTCNYCTFETSVKTRLTYHTNTKHLKRSFNCAHCDFVTNVKSRLIGHINAKHIKYIAFNCSYCSYNTCLKSNLDRHINIKHTKSNIFKCSFCSYETYNKNSLTKHVNAKHTKTDVFTCSYCSFKSYQKTHLNVHVNVKHTKTKAFHCSFCSFKSYNKMHLKKHINARHTKVNVFICSYCNLQVYYKENLIRHIKVKHS